MHECLVGKRWIIARWDLTGASAPEPNPANRNRERYRLGRFGGLL